MAKRYDISESQKAEIAEYRKKNKKKNVERRLRAISLYAEGEERTEIAEKTGYAKSYIGELVSKYCNKGISSIVDNHYGGNHRNLSYAEEEEMLEPFKKMAAAGEIVEISAIKTEYEEKTGLSLENNHGQIYRVLARHGWRKVMPRSKHPNRASEEEIESSKKLTNVWRVKEQIFPESESD